MRKKKHAEHVNHERWLVSYADFITLLFAFFVVMFAVSQVDTKKLGHFTEAFSKAVGVNVMPMSGSSILDGTALDQVDNQIAAGEVGQGELDGLGHELLEMAAQRKDALRGLQIIRRGNDLVLRLPEAIFFDIGDARVKTATIGTLKLIAPKIAERHVEVRVEGYTDDRPIVSGRYRSNWELSTARAINVMTALMGAGITPDRVSIAGYGEYRPVASNGTEDGRKQNRRVDLVVTPLHTPAGAAGAADAGDGDLAADGDDAGATTPGDGE